MEARRGCFRWRASWAVAGGTCVLVAAASLAAVAGDDAPTSVTLVLRGEAVDPATFALTGLQGDEERAAVEAVRARLVEDCQRDGNSSGLADGAEPTEHRVEIPGGAVVEVSTSWTPESCLYRSFAEIAAVRRTRAAHHLAVAGANRELVSAWVELVDAEVAVARRLDAD